MTSLEEALAGPVDQVAPRLLGALLHHNDVTLRLTEVEAYAGADDPGSHAYRGRTARNAVMFGPAGRLYVYLSYGMHVCANVSCGDVGTPSAVLLRAGDVVEGLDEARQRRRGSSDRNLARGPGRLCQALGLTLTDNGADLTGESVRLELGGSMLAHETGPRVGLRGAPERPWRYWLPGERSVSAYRPAKRVQTPRGA